MGHVTNYHYRPSAALLCLQAFPYTQPLFLPTGPVTYELSAFGPAPIHRATSCSITGHLGLGGLAVLTAVPEESRSLDPHPDQSYGRRDGKEVR